MWKPVSISFFLFFLIPAGVLTAQQSDTEQVEELIEQERYEEALPILQQRQRQNPESEHHLERLISTWIRAGESDRALEHVETMLEEDHPLRTTLQMKRADLLHRTGQRDEAVDAWRELMERYRNNLSIYYEVGNTLMDRRESELAIEFFNKARHYYHNTTLFTNEIISAWLQLGERERAVEEYVNLVQGSPGRESYVRQRLRQFRDSRMLESAVDLTRARLKDMNPASPHYAHMRGFLLWLLMETESYDELVEQVLGQGGNEGMEPGQVMELAAELESAHRYELAAEIYAHGIESERSETVTLALDQLASLRIRWADHLGDRGLEGQLKAEELLQNAYDESKMLLERYPDYDERAEVLLRLTALAIDPPANPEQAGQWLSRLEKDAGNREDLRPKISWLQGRVALLDREWREARHAFQRALEGADRDQLRNESRLYLGLTEFLSGKFDYASIQLRTLEQESDSYVSNRALKIRLWIQEGKRADTTGKAINLFAELISDMESGNADRAFAKLQMLEENGHQRLAEFALVELAGRFNPDRLEQLHEKLSTFNRRTSDSPVRERLLWHQAQISGRLGKESEGGDNGREQRADLLKQLIIEFPNGFFSPQARRELQALEQTDL